MSQPGSEHIPSIFDDEAAQAMRRKLAHGIGKARNTLYLVSAMLFLSDLLIVLFRFGVMDMGRVLLIAVTDGMLIIVLIMLGFYAKSRPFNALLIGLLLYTFIQVVALFMHLYTVEHNAFTSMMIIGLLCSGLRRAQIVQRSLDFGEKRI